MSDEETVCAGAMASVTIIEKLKDDVRPADIYVMCMTPTVLVLVNVIGLRQAEAMVREIAGDAVSYYKNETDNRGKLDHYLRYVKDIDPALGITLVDVVRFNIIGAAAVFMIGDPYNGEGPFWEEINDVLDSVKAMMGIDA